MHIIIGPFVMTRRATIWIRSWIEYGSKERRPHLNTMCRKAKPHNAVQTDARTICFGYFIFDRVKHLPPNRETKSAEANKHASETVRSAAATIFDALFWIFRLPISGYKPIKSTPSPENRVNKSVRNIGTCCDRSRFLCLLTCTHRGFEKRIMLMHSVIYIHILFFTSKIESCLTHPSNRQLNLAYSRVRRDRNHLCSPQRLTIAEMLIISSNPKTIDVISLNDSEIARSTR